MARIHGKNTSFYLDDSTGASTSLTGDGNNTALNETVKNPEATAYGNNAVQRAASGIYDLKFTYEGWANDGEANNFRIFQGAKGLIRRFIWGPAGSGASAIKYSACVLIDDVEIKSPLEGLVTCKAYFSNGSGSLTSACFP